jgi:hypothetical protein
VVNKIGFKSHSPFNNIDPLWLPYGDARNGVKGSIIKLNG